MPTRMVSVRFAASEAVSKVVDQLARKITGDGAITLARRRGRALSRLCTPPKVALIERIAAVGHLDPPQGYSSSKCSRSTSTQVGCPAGGFVHPNRSSPQQCCHKSPSDPPKPYDAPLSELLKLDRYERCAASHRERAITQL